MIEYNEPFNQKNDGGISTLNNICKQLLEAISYIHEENVVHLDIKPENILVTKNRSEHHITLIDFNLSQKLVKDKVKLSNVCGTLDYKAPEVLTGNTVTSAVDMWSVGIFLYALCVGYFPKALNW